MADQSDVEIALVAAITAIIYPNGTASLSAIGTVCRIYRGWPLSAQLNADLAAGIINISVVPSSSLGEDDRSIRLVAAFNDGWTGSAGVVTISAVTDGTCVTFSGSPAAGQLVGALVDGRAYVYGCTDGDTLASVAAALADLISADITATSAGATVTVPEAYQLSGRTGATAKLWREIRRQRQRFSIMFWCPTPQSRDSAVALVDMNLAGMKFLNLVDGSSARLIFADTSSQDQNQNAGMYRRDLVYQLEYATTVTMTTANMLFGELDVNGATIYS